VSVKNSMRNPSHVPKDVLKLVNQDSVMAATHTSEMSVASELSNAIGDEAMESDIDPNEENCMPVVDHMPPPALSLLLRRSTSVKKRHQSRKWTMKMMMMRKTILAQ
jgi:hypothetical protein